MESFPSQIGFQKFSSEYANHVNPYTNYLPFGCFDRKMDNELADLTDTSWVDFEGTRWVDLTCAKWVVLLLQTSFP